MFSVNPYKSGISQKIIPILTECMKTAIYYRDYISTKCADEYFHIDIEPIKIQYMKILPKEQYQPTWKITTINHSKYFLEKSLPDFETYKIKCKRMLRGYFTK